MKIIFIIPLMLSVAQSLKFITNQKQTHLQPENKETIAVKFRQSDVQDINSCDPKEDTCEVLICPDTNVMKASYSCYSVVKE